MIAEQTQPQGPLPRAPCTHRRATLVKLTCADGSLRFAGQCTLCGDTVTQWIPGKYLKYPRCIPERDAVPIIRKEELVRQELAVLQHERLHVDRLKAEAYALRRTFYDNYITNNPHWKALRQQAIARAGGRCERCGRSASWFEVHHVTYERLGAEHLDDLRALCGPCHTETHNELRDREVAC